MTYVDIEKSPAGAQWKKIGVIPRHGVDLSLSSLRSKKSSGSGEFYDLLPLGKWLSSCGFQVIQLLPLNDSGHDPSPYNALSSCALNPLYLSLHKLPQVRPIPAASSLNELPRLSYTEVQSFKLNFLRTYYEEGGSALVDTSSFQAFAKQNPWLTPYALFKVLKDRLNHNPWTSWPAELKKGCTEQLVEKHMPEMLFYMVVQYLCFEQLKAVKKELNSYGILLKGDIPILISADSVETWLHPELFDLGLAAGVPPDAYSQEGQYWGFPLFKWEAVKSQNFSWWKERLWCVEQCYDLYRIDHVVGFFHIWAIPLNQPPKEGKFIPENPAAWVPQGKEILQVMLNSSPLLPIAEDLGDVPPSVRLCLKELGICGTKVIRWEKKYEESLSFIPFSDYPPLSLTTVSTHDSEPLQLWWQNNVEEAKHFATFLGWEYSPDLSFEQRLQLLQKAHHTPSLFHINLLQEYLALFPELVWPHPQDERINIPGQVLPTNWTYRFRPFLEEIIAHPGLKACMQQIVR